MIIMKNSGLLEIDYAEKLLLTIFCRGIQTTATDGGSVDFASLHGKDCSYNPIAFPPFMEVRCNLLGQCRSYCRGAITEELLPILPWMDCSRTTQEQLSRSSCRGASHRPDSLSNFSKRDLTAALP